MWQACKSFFQNITTVAPPPAPQEGERQLSPEMMRTIKEIQVKTNHLVNHMMAGEYVSAFKGKGMEFREVREYEPGDDIRLIEWNVTARMGHPYVKEFREEREMTVMLMVDVSSSGRFGSHQKTKNDFRQSLHRAINEKRVNNAPYDSYCHKNCVTKPPCTRPHQHTSSKYGHQCGRKNRPHRDNSPCGKRCWRCK